MNLHWQFNASANLMYSLVQVKDSIIMSPTVNENNYSANFFGTLGYYPNSRTYFTGSLAVAFMANYSRILNPAPAITADGHQFGLIPNFMLNGYYYISQKLRLKGYWSLNYNYYKISDNYNPSVMENKSFNQSFLLSLTYSLF